MINAFYNNHNFTIIIIPLQPSAWDKPPVPDDLPPPSQRYKQLYKDYEDDMKESYQKKGHEDFTEVNYDIFNPSNCTITKICPCNMEIYFSCKNWKFHLKNLDDFNIFAQNIDCGYTLELP